jgi:penicillin-binding protein 2
MSIFNPSEEEIAFKQSKKEKMVAQSEHWSAAILNGSDKDTASVEPIKTNFFKYFLSIISLVAVILIVQLINLQIVNGQKNALYADGNRIRQRITRAERGVIYDKDKQVLVRNLASFDLTLTPSQLPKDKAQESQVINQASQLVSVDESQINDKVSKFGRNYSLPIIIAGDINREKALMIEEKISSLNGFSLDTNPIREYLDQSSLSHFLGYTGRISSDDKVDNQVYNSTDLIGKSGLEKSYEQQLKGTNGREQFEVDSTGNPVKLLASKDPVAGNSLVLSIDKGLEDKMYQSLNDGLKRSGSQRGVALALNPNNGQILAAVSLPSYDNNLFAKKISQSDYDKLANDPNKPLLNRISSGAYPIGSTIKPFDAAAALQEKLINPSTTIEDRGRIDVPNVYNPSIVYTFKGWKPDGLGPVNAIRAITWSSDIFFYVVAGGYQNFKGLGAEKLISYLKKFGFGRKTGIDTNEEVAGYLPTPESKKAKTNEQWYIGDTYNLAIGQGNLQATPLQLLVATSAIANGGTIYKPRLVSEIIDINGASIEKTKPEAVTENLISSEYLSTIREGMRRVVSEGTACCQIKNDVPVSVSGKTGTAETSSAGFDGKNPRTKPHAYFTSYAPSDNPQIAMVVMVENSGEGAEYAVPITNDILKWYFSSHK